MLRDIYNALIVWKEHPLRKPLILRGARQVGKSWLVQQFGKTFRSFVELNFEKEKGAKVLFSGDIQVPKLLEKLSLYSGRKIVPAETLLFLDEIQECPEAIGYLRYFKEECPNLQVIAAGSLIEFALEELGLPVGRVQFLHLYPLSFGEFLVAQNRKDLREHIWTGEADPVFHAHLLDLLQTYMWLGGMPAVVQAWLDHKDAHLCQEIQDEILGAYRQDFSKYAKRRQISHVVQVFESIPLQLGKKFQLSQVDPHTRAQSLKLALFLLEKAGIALPAYHSSGQGLPLGAMKNEKKFKVFFFDIGLAQRILGLDLKSWTIGPMKVVNIGAIAEQLIAQELAAYAFPRTKPQLYYWHRETPSSNAEVDLLFAKEGAVIPVEVKSGTKGGLKSIQLFLDTHPHSPYGLKISEGVFATHGRVREIPLYGVEAWLGVKKS